MYLRLLQIVALASSATVLAAQTPQAQKPARTLVRAGRLLDVRTGREFDAQTIVVVGDRILAIAPTASTPVQPGDRELDLRSSTVLPGLIDCHTHLTMGRPISILTLSFR